MARYVPRRVPEQINQGFSSPDASRCWGASIDYVRSVIFDNKSRSYEFLQPRAVPHLVQEHLDGRQHRRLLLWSLLQFETWCHVFLDR